MVYKMSSWRRKAEKKREKMVYLARKSQSRRIVRKLQEKIAKDVEWILDVARNVKSSQGHWRTNEGGLSDAKFMLKFISRYSIWENLIAEYMKNTCPVARAGKDCSPACCLPRTMRMREVNIPDYLI